MRSTVSNEKGRQQQTRPIRRAMAPSGLGLVNIPSFPLPTPSIRRTNHGAPQIHHTTATGRRARNKSTKSPVQSTVKGEPDTIRYRIRYLPCVRMSSPYIMTRQSRPSPHFFVFGLAAKFLHFPLNRPNLARAWLGWSAESPSWHKRYI